MTVRWATITAASSIASSGHFPAVFALDTHLRCGNADTGRIDTPLLNARMSVYDAHMSAQPSITRWSTISPDDVRKGIPAVRIDAFAALGIERSQILRAIGAPSTLRRRIKNKARLTREESDRLARLGRIVEHAIEVFGSPEKAGRWLTRPMRTRTDSATPFDLMDTDPGAERVDEQLTQIAHGMFP